MSRSGLSSFVVRNRWCIRALTACVALAASDSALAWGSNGHRLIGELALQSLPPELPAFLHKAEAGRQVAEVAREPDRAKGASGPHDSDASAAHYVDAGDDLKIARGPSLLALPAIVKPMTPRCGRRVPTNIARDICRTRSSTRGNRW
jgi:hypothetical protein